MRAQVKREIEQFIVATAPGLTVEFIEHDALGSTTISVGVKIENRRMVPRKYDDREAGGMAIEMLAEVQKAAVTAIGLEAYIRERELAVLDRLQDRLATRADDAEPSDIEAVRRELGETD